mgnify:CR=1 FL=1
MSVQKVKELLTPAILRFAKTEQVEPTEINLFIHSPEPYNPSYFYRVKSTKKTEKLNFRKDILFKKIDMFNVTGTVAVFLAEKFKFYEMSYEEKGYLVEDIYFLIRPKDNEVQDFLVAIYHKADFVEQITLESIFEQE